jgi:hypothetical protein
MSAKLKAMVTSFLVCRYPNPDMPELKGECQNFIRAANMMMSNMNGEYGTRNFLRKNKRLKNIDPGSKHPILGKNQFFDFIQKRCF